MKKIKILFTLLSLLMFVGVSNAQTSAQETNKQKTERYIKALKLSDDQAAKSRELSAKYEQLITNAANADEKKKYWAELDNEVQQLLTSEQYAQYKELRAKDKREQAVKAKVKDTRSIAK